MSTENGENTVARMRNAFLSKRYFIAFLEPTEKAGDRGVIRTDHFRYVKALEEAGHLMLAGPYIDEGTDKPNGYGMFVLRAESRAAAEAIMNEEPFTKQGYRTYRLQLWQINEGNLNLSISLSEQKVRFG
jgi:uncharacterized protein YciI